MKVHRFSLSSISSWAARTQNKFVLALNSMTFHFVLLNFISFLLLEFPRSSNSACLVFNPSQYWSCFPALCYEASYHTSNSGLKQLEKDKCQKEEMQWRSVKSHPKGQKTHQWQSWNNINPPVPNPLVTLTLHFWSGVRRNLQAQKSDVH